MNRIRSTNLTRVLGWLAVVSCASFMPQDQIELSRIVEKFKEYVKGQHQEKLYLCLDRQVYAAGESMWFSAYLLDASYHNLDSTSKVVYVELLNPQKQLVARRVLYSPFGLSAGDIQLQKNLAPGHYMLRAYTNSMRNIGDDHFFFNKAIEILNVVSQKETEKVMATPAFSSIYFFPEGGNLIANTVNRVAFKSIDQYGIGIPAEGEIVDGSGSAVALFKTGYDGMGMFQFTPMSQHAYSAQVKLAGIFPLPQVLAKGYLLRAADVGGSINVVAFGNQIDGETLSVVAQSRGVVYFAGKGKSVNSSIVVKIPKRNIPSGILQITLFDSNGTAQAERLIFINHEDGLIVSVKTDKDQYQKRTLVKVKIDVRDEIGAPAIGNFSMSVYDASIDTTAKFSSTIVDNLLLTSDLGGYVHDPAHYLKDTTAATKSHADLLMMTHGWRRFTWKSILSDESTALAFPHEQGLPISGQVLTRSGKPVQSGQLSIATSEGLGLDLLLNKDGRFYTDQLKYFDSTQLIIQTNDAKGKKSDLGFVLDSFATPATTEKYPLSQGSLAISDASVVARAEATAHAADVREDSVKSRMLKEVEVKATKIEQDAGGPPIARLYRPDIIVKMKDISYSPRSVFQVLQGRVAGVQVVGIYPFENIIIRNGVGNFSGGIAPLFLLDGAPTTLDMIQSLPIEIVESVELAKGLSPMYGSRGSSSGVLAVYTKRNHAPVVRHDPVYGIQHIKYPGFYRAREFYSPDHSTKNQSTPDARITLYWNPFVISNEMGEAEVSFYTSDVSSTYKIVIEGIADDGTPGAVVKRIVVRP